MCQRIGRPPISTIGLGFVSFSSASREPKPPARITVCIRRLPRFNGSPGPIRRWSRYSTQLAGKSDSGRSLLPVMALRSPIPDPVPPPLAGAGQRGGARVWNIQVGTCVLIPCLNEAATIGGLVADFRRDLPQATIVVLDNGSTDGSAAQAAAAGATVLTVPRRGKGYVLRAALDRVRGDC